MDFVGSEQDVGRNLAYLDAARTEPAGASRQAYEGLVQRGTCFLAYLSDGRLAFAPSRFIGYKDNNFTRHDGNSARDGRLTTPILSEILGAEPQSDDAAERAYRAFCVSLGVQPRASGTAGAPRRYWLSAEAERYLRIGDTASALSRGPAKFEVGHLYDRDQVADILRLPEAKRKGNWLTGYSRQDDEFIVFANVGIAGRTGHDYANHWRGKQLVWMARGNAVPGQRELTDLLSGNFPVHIFWRGRDRGGFTYAGPAVAAEASDNRPVQVVWTFQGSAPPTATTSIVSRRGPPPTSGTRSTTRVDGDTQIYLMCLEGPVSSAFPYLRPGQRVIKIGMSNHPERRLEDLSCGFPPGCALHWTLIATRTFPTGEEAFTAEGRLLDQLRLSGSWIGGEFAVVSEPEFEALSTLGD